jgi:hypothetical protein
VTPTDLKIGTRPPQLVFTRLPLRSRGGYDLVICVVYFQTTLSNRLACNRFPLLTDSSLEATGPARLEVFNILGQKVVTLYNDIAEAGVYHTVRLDGTSLSSGIYFYQLESGQKNQLKKLMLVK